MGVTRAAYPSVGECEPMGHEAGNRAPLSGPAQWQPTGGAGFPVDGVRSLEVRWIFAGQPAAATVAWFGRFPAETVTLEDVYLVDPLLPGLSVKVRQGQALEVKIYHGSRGVLEVPGRALGNLQAWQKWSFPCAPVALGEGDQAGWRTVRKNRRICRFSQAYGADVTPDPRPGEAPQCAVELAQVHALDGNWWTLAFEATGPADVLRGQLSAAAALVFAQALPGAKEPDINDSMSYAQWLRGQPGLQRVPGQRGAALDD
jgi:hypothetical protein